MRPPLGVTLVYVGRVEESAGNEVASLVDLAGDLAGTFPRTPSSGSNVDPELADADLAAVLRDGYVVLPDLLSETDVDEIRRTVEPLLDLRGRNGFEGAKTQRVYSVLNKTRSCDRIADHPRVLALLDRLFMPNYLLSMLQVINILPGEQAQMLHTDDGFYPLPRPRAPLGAATIWAVDDFTADNGATDVVPGSQLWDDRLPGDDAAKAALSITVFTGDPATGDKVRDAIRAAGYPNVRVNPLPNADFNIKWGQASPRLVEDLVRIATRSTGVSASDFSRQNILTRDSSDVYINLPVTTLGPGGIPTSCGQAETTADFGPIAVGTQVTLGRHTAVNDDTNWNDQMDAYVGQTASVGTLNGVDGAGCPVVKVDVDQGIFSWRIRDLRLAR